MLVVPLHRSARRDPPGVPIPVPVPVPQQTLAQPGDCSQTELTCRSPVVMRGQLFGLCQRADVAKW